MEMQINGNWFEVIVDPIFDAAGRYNGAVHIVSDITARKQAEERISEQAALLDAANDAIYVRALDYTVTYWNDGAERLYGWTRAEALGRKTTDLGDVDHEAFAAAHAALLERGNWSGELKKTTKTGRECVVFCRWTLLRDKQGRPREVLAINTDVSEQKQLTAQFLRAQRVESVGRLAGGIAHDLNNILAPILMVGPLLRDALASEEHRSVLDMVVKSAQRGADIVKQLLLFARGTEGQKVPLPAGLLIKEMAKIVRETFPKSITLTTEFSKELWTIMGDPTQLHQVLLNLCLNADDAMPDGGTLTLAAENVTLDECYARMIPEAKAGPYVVLQVADTGTGIPPEIMDKIFDPFFTTKGPDKGTGLGLATVLGIVKSHGGFIQVESRVGHGSQFKVYLPAVPAPASASSPAPAPCLPKGNGELILVVDDEPSIRNVTRQTLEKNGYRALTAAEGTEAMALYAQHQAEIQMVLTDLLMPIMDGVATIRALREKSATLKIIATSGEASKSKLKEIADLPLQAFLQKPFTAETLLVTVQKVLGGGVIPVGGAAERQRGPEAS